MAVGDGFERGLDVGVGAMVFLSSRRLRIIEAISWSCSC